MSIKNAKPKNAASAVISGSLIIIAVSILAKFASFIAESVNAAYLGMDKRSDAFYMISSIQEIIYPMLSIGISKVFLPAYKRHISLGEDEKANVLANRMMTFLALITVGVVALLIIFARPVVSLIAVGFDDQTADLCADLIRISAPMYLFIIFAATYSAMLQSRNRFFASKIREVVSHIPPILCVILLYNRLGGERGLYALAVSLVVGALCRLLIELPFVNWKYRYKPNFSFKDEEFRHVVVKLPPALITAGIAQINSLIDKMMASTFEEGAISALHYGTKLNHVLSGLLSTAVATAFYPQMIELITLDKKEELNRIITKIINIFCVLMIPVTIAGYMFSVPIIKVVYERGAFDASSTELTAGVFAFYCLGLLFYACSGILTNVFYGHGDTKTPMIISLITITINIILNFVFSKLLGISGLALATSVSGFIGIIIKFILCRKYVTINWKKEAFLVFRILVASFAAIVPAYFVSGLIANKYLMLICAACVGITLYLVFNYLLRIRVLSEVVSLVTKKLHKKRKKAAERE